MKKYNSFSYSNRLWSWKVRLY